MKHKFKKGNKFGKGRQKGSKNKLSQKFIEVLYADFKENGQEAIDLLRDTDLATYARIIASLVPKDIDIQAEIAGDSDRPIIINFVPVTEKPQEVIEVKDVLDYAALEDASNG